MVEKSNKQTEPNKETSCCAPADRKRIGSWEKPLLEDVSGKIMAQPYIRFT